MFGKKSPVIPLLTLATQAKLGFTNTTPSMSPSKGKNSFDATSNSTLTPSAFVSSASKTPLSLTGLSPSLQLRRSSATQKTETTPALSDHCAVSTALFFSWNVLKRCRKNPCNNGFDIEELNAVDYEMRATNVFKKAAEIAEEASPEIGYFFQESPLPKDTDIMAKTIGLYLDSVATSSQNSQPWRFEMNHMGLAAIIKSSFYIHEPLMDTVSSIKIGNTPMSDVCQIFTDGNTIVINVHAPLRNAQPFMQILFEQVCKAVAEENSSIRTVHIVGDLNSDYKNTSTTLEKTWEKVCSDYQADHKKSFPLSVNAEGIISEKGHCHSGEHITADAVWSFNFTPSEKPTFKSSALSFKKMLALLVASGFMSTSEMLTLDEAGFLALTLSHLKMIEEETDLMLSTSITSSSFYSVPRSKPAIEDPASDEVRKIFGSMQSVL